MHGDDLKVDISRMPPEHARLMRIATACAVLVASLLIAVKLVTWLYTGSVSILSSLADSMIDVLASLINMYAVHHSLQPADKEHRFGHGKAEPLSGLAQAAFITGTAIFILMEASDHMVNQRVVEHASEGIWVMLFSIVVTFALVFFQRHVIRLTGSVAISADSLHYKGDVLINGSVILALVASDYMGSTLIDPVIAVVIALYILYCAVKIGRDSLNLLMDHELPDEDRERIREIAISHSEVRDIHDLRTRSSGLQTFIQLHLEMDGAITLDEAHEISEDVMHKILAVFPNAEVLIHEDPEGVDEERVQFDD